MARAGLRRGELCGLRRSDVHLVMDSRPLGCEVARAHMHVIRREGNPNGAWAKSRRQRAVPLDFLVVQAFDTYELERMGVAEAAASDFVFVNLARGVIGAPVRPDAVGELLAAAGALERGDDALAAPGGVGLPSLPHGLARVPVATSPRRSCRACGTGRHRDRPPCALRATRRNLRTEVTSLDSKWIPERKSALGRPGSPAYRGFCVPVCTSLAALRDIVHLILSAIVILALDVIAPLGICSRHVVVRQVRTLSRLLFRADRQS